MRYVQRVYSSGLAAWCYYVDTAIVAAPDASRTSPNWTGSITAHEVLGVTADSTVDYITSPTTGDYYLAPAAVALGANDFIVAVWWRPSQAALADTGNVYGLIQARTGAGDGWQISWDFGSLQVLCADGSAVDFGGHIGASVWYGGEPSYPMERDCLIVMRVTGGAGTARLRTYANGGLIQDLTAANTGIDPGTSVMKLGGDAGFGDPMDGGVVGAAYLAGTLTDAQLQAWTETCISSGGLVLGAVAWTNMWSTLLSTPGASWPDSGSGAKNLTRTGSTGTQQRQLRIA